MIYIIDDFLEAPILNAANAYLNNGPFVKTVSGEKDFYIKESPDDFTQYIVDRLTVIEKRPVASILAFFREATTGASSGAMLFTNFSTAKVVA